MIQVVMGTIHLQIIPHTKFLIIFSYVCMGVKVEVRFGNETFQVSKNINYSLISICGFTDFHLVQFTVILLTLPIRFSVLVYSLYPMNKILLLYSLIPCSMILYFHMLVFTDGFVEYQHSGQFDIVGLSSIDLKWPCG